MKKNTKKAISTRRVFTEEERAAAKKDTLSYIIGVCKFLSDNDMPFTLSSTNGNYQLESKYIKKRTYQATQTVTPTELGFVNRVRNHVKREGIALNFVNQYFESDIVYMETRTDIRNQTIKNVVEIDIDQAYWDTALQLGVLDEKLYAMGLSEEISKRARLVALGSLAKKVYHYRFHGRQMIGSDVERSEDTENIWFTICKRVSDVMLEIAEAIGDDYIFFWVDGIYLKNNSESIAKAQEIIEKWNYQSKIKEIDRIECGEKQLLVYADENDTKCKRFNYVFNTKKRSFRRDQDLLKLCQNVLSSKYKAP